jgi:uncharacterized membrane protein
MIRTPPKKVWEMLALDRFQEWDEGTQKNVKSMEYTSEVHTPEDKYRVGATAHMNKKREGIDFEITESLENEKITYHVKEPKMNVILTYILEPVEQGTKFTYAIDYELPWGIFGKFLNKLFGQKMVKKELERSLENLKTILEK